MFTLEAIIEADSKTRSELRREEERSEKELQDKIEAKTAEIKESLAGTAISTDSIVQMAKAEAVRAIKAEQEAETARKEAGEAGSKEADFGEENAAGPPASSSTSQEALAAKRKDYICQEESNKRARQVLSDARKQFAMATGAYTDASLLLADELGTMDAS